MKSARWDGKSRGGVTGYKIFVYIIKNINVSFAYLLLRLVVVYYVFFAPKSFLSTFRYFKYILGYNWFKSLISTYKNFYVFGTTLIDKVVVYLGIDNVFTYEFIGEEYIKGILEQNKGAILISAHVGNWEIASQMLNRLNRKVNVVMFDNEHENLKKYFADIHENKSFNTIVIKNDLDHV
jgi:predicted LPLAT superfamily acyltransferase